MRRVQSRLCTRVTHRHGGPTLDQEQRRSDARRLARRSPVPEADRERCRPPEPVPPSAWVLPAPDQADADGVVGVGADLAPSTLVDAYRRGLFPWPHHDSLLPWFSPDPRGVLRLPDLHVSRSLRRTLRTSGWTATVDRAFGEVVQGCREDRGPAGTWITSAMAEAYGRLHELAWARSVEVWDDERLVGGLYGVQVGGVFTGESMFHRVSDASKVALVELMVRFCGAGGRLLDVQLTTDHLRSLGAVDVSRPRFLEELHEVRDDEVLMRTGGQPVARLPGALEDRA